MINDQNRVYDGWLSLEGGVDAGRAPNMIGANQCVNAINMTFRGGSATPRPGFRILNETFPAQFYTDPVDGLVKTKQVWCFGETHQVNPTSDLWLYSSNLTMAAPGSGHIRGNRPHFSLITQMAISHLSHSSIDEAALLGSLLPGYAINFYDITQPAIWAQYLLTGTPVNNGTWFLLNVSFMASSPGMLADTDELELAFTQIGAPGDLHIQGEYKPDSIIVLSNPDPPYQDTAPWFANQSSQDIYKNGKLQCAIRYSPHNGEDCIMAMIGGRLFKIIPRIGGADVREIQIMDTPRNLRNMERLPIAYMVQADKWLIAQDGVSSAIIYDGNTARRSNTNTTVDQTEIPVGTIMAYGMGRISVVVQERDVAFGDLYGSHDFPDPSDSIILFTERNFLAEGFDAAIPFQQGRATGAIFFPQLDTSTGNGQLMVFSERGASSFFLSLDRTQWKTTPGFQTLSLLTTGLRGHRSLAVVNEDLWFRADDGIRSFRQARSEQTGWAHIPLSTNVRQYIDNDADWLLKYASGIYFNNRIIFTTSPMWHQGRPMHWGMVVVDFDVLSSFGAKFNPAWEGQWTMSSFIFPTQLLTGTFNGIERAFVFGIDNHNQNQLYELSMDDKDDWNYQPIQWEFESRTLDFVKMTQNPMPFSENELYDGDVWLKEISE